MGQVVFNLQVMYFLAACMFSPMPCAAEGGSQSLNSRNTPAALLSW